MNFYCGFVSEQNRLAALAVADQQGRLFSWAIQDFPWHQAKGPALISQPFLPEAGSQYWIISDELPGILLSLVSPQANLFSLSSVQLRNSLSEIMSVPDSWNFCHVGAAAGLDFPTPGSFTEQALYCWRASRLQSRR